MYASIGYGKTNVEQVTQKLLKFESDEKKKDEEVKPKEINQAEISNNGSSEIRVSDLEEDVEVKFAKCCTPVPGDPIIGFITKGNGISVHVKNCPNIINLKSPERLIDVYWQNSKEDKFPVKIQILTSNAPSVLYDITKMISTVNVNILGINARTDQEQGTIDLIIEVNNMDQLSDVITKLKSLRTVDNVYRIKN